MASKDASVSVGAWGAVGATVCAGMSAQPARPVRAMARIRSDARIRHHHPSPSTMGSGGSLSSATVRDSNAQSYCSPALPRLRGLRHGPILYDALLADVERRGWLAGVRNYT